MGATFVAPLQQAWQSYCGHLVRRPLATKVITGVVGTLLGDGIAQGAAHWSKRRAALASRSRPPRFRYDAARAARLCLYAAAIGTPVGHYWFGLLDARVFPGRMGHPTTALAKVALDQLIMAPAGLALFYVALSLMEGRPWAEAVSVMRAKFAPTMAANYALWPAAQLVNFKFVPPEQRILYVNAVYVGWATFLSTMAAAPIGGVGDGGGGGGGGGDSSKQQPLNPAAAVAAAAGDKGDAGGVKTE